MAPHRYYAIPLGIILLLSGAVSHSSWELPHPALSRPLVEMAPRHPWIALTFDDGPHPGMTEKLLGVLKDEGVPGTFFIVGKMGVRYPWLVQEISRQGNEVANHTFTHPNMTNLSNKSILNELAQTRTLIQQLTGQDTRLYRPPGGDYSKRTLHTASVAGYHMILWTVLTKDVNGASPAAMRQHILRTASDGGIVLMHSGVPSTLEMLPEVIETLRKQGYHFVTVSQLLGFETQKSHHPIPSGPLPEAPYVALK